MNETVVTENEVDKELREVLAFGFSLAEAVDMAHIDGKFDLTDLGLMIGPFTLIGSAIDGVAKLKHIGKLSPAKLTELSAWAKTDLDLRHDPTEERVEAVLDVVVRIAGLLSMFKK